MFTKISEHVNQILAEPYTKKLEQVKSFLLELKPVAHKV